MGFDVRRLCQSVRDLGEAKLNRSPGLTGDLRGLSGHGSTLSGASRFSELYVIGFRERVLAGTEMIAYALVNGESLRVGERPMRFRYSLAVSAVSSFVPG